MTTATATGLTDDDPARWDTIEDEGSIRGAPWLFDPDGCPVKAPARCIGFQVRYWPPGSRGIGELVIDRRSRVGVPLLVPRTTGPDEFLELVGGRPGRYRLFLVDEQFERMRNAPAQVVIPEPNEGEAGDERGRRATAPPAQAEVLSQVLIRVIEMVERGQGHVYGSISDVLRAAGESGVVAKTAALAAAHAGASVVFAAPVSAAPGPASSWPPAAPASPPPSSGTEAPRNGSGKTEAAKPDESDDELTPFDRWVRMAEPMLGPTAKVVAAKVGQMMGISTDDLAKIFGGASTPAPASDAAVDAWTKATSTDEPEAEDEAEEAPRDEAPDGLTGAALDVHLAALRGQLSADELQALAGLAIRHHGRFDELKALVGRMTLERALAVTRKLMAVWRALTDVEQTFLGSLIESPRGGIGSVLAMVEERSVANSIAIIRTTKAQAEKRHAA